VSNRHPPAIAIPQFIRNRGVRRWPTTVMRVCLLSAGICCLLAILIIKIGVPRHFAVLLLLPALLGVVGAIWFALDLLVKRPIEKVLLGESMQLWPSRTTYSVHDVSQIEFAADGRGAEITVRSQWNFRWIKLILDPEDAARLAGWAKEHGIPIGLMDEAKQRNGT
jgi:hypothetical protein